MKERIIKPVLSGDKIICLAITEPYTGSDVANIKCSAVLSENGEYFTVNGMKKWITGGYHSDYFTTAVVTAPENGMFGLSLLLIEKTFPGINLRKMNC
jgi:alkylation response protein AidB-like acyl-CoA dehydrogenase